MKISQNRRRKSTCEAEGAPAMKRLSIRAFADVHKDTVEFFPLSIDGKTKTLGEFLKENRAIQGLHSVVLQCKKATYEVLSQQESASEDNKLCCEFLATFLNNLPIEAAAPNEIYKISQTFMKFLPRCRSLLAQHQLQWSLLKTQLGEYWTNWESFYFHRNLNLLFEIEADFESKFFYPPTEIKSKVKEELKTVQTKEEIDSANKKRLLATLETLSRHFEDLQPEFSDLIRDFKGPIEHIQVENKTQQIVQLLHDKITEEEKIFLIDIEPFCRAALNLQNYYSQLVNVLETEEEKENVLSDFFRVLENYKSGQGFDLEEIAAQISKDAQLELHQLSHPPIDQFDYEAISDEGEIQQVNSSVESDFKESKIICQFESRIKSVERPEDIPLFTGGIDAKHRELKARFDRPSPTSQIEVPRNDVKVECLGSFFTPTQIVKKLGSILERHKELYEGVDQILKQKIQAFNKSLKNRNLSPRELVSVRIWKLISNSLPSEKPNSSPEVQSEEEIILVLKSSVAIWFHLLKNPEDLSSVEFVNLESWLSSYSDRRSSNAAIALHTLMNFYENKIFAKYEESLEEVSYLKPTKFARDLAESFFAVLFSKLDYFEMDEQLKKSLLHLAHQGLQIFLSSENFEINKMKFDLTAILSDILASHQRSEQNGARNFQNLVLQFFEVIRLSLFHWMEDSKLSWKQIKDEIRIDEFFASAWEIFDDSEDPSEVFEQKSDEFFAFFNNAKDELEGFIRDISF